MLDTHLHFWDLDRFEYAWITRGAEPLGKLAAAFGDGRRDLGGVLSRSAGLLGAYPGLPLGRRGSTKRICPAPNGIRAFFGSAHS